jgi:acyl carrier protein
MSLLNTMSNTASSPLLQPADQAETPAEITALAREIAGLIVEALNLELTAAEIDIEGALYGEGLGLDSIDVLEIALVVSKRYGVQLRADSEDNEKIFRSLRRLAEYIAAHRTK